MNISFLQFSFELFRFSSFLTFFFCVEKGEATRGFSFWHEKLHCCRSILWPLLDCTRENKGERCFTKRIMVSSYTQARRFSIFCKLEKFHFLQFYIFCDFLLFANIKIFEIENFWIDKNEGKFLTGMKAN